MGVVNDLLALRAALGATATDPKRCESVDDVISQHFERQSDANVHLDWASLKALKAIDSGDFPEDFVK